MYSKKDYLKALEEREKYGMDTKEWQLCQAKVQAITTTMVAMGNTWMVNEIIDELSSLNDCGCGIDDEAVQFNLWVLKSNGYKKEAMEMSEIF